jgi:GNAT superfamily N-acetyltransferase
VHRLAARGYVTQWFRNVFACLLEERATRSHHPSMVVTPVGDDLLDQWFAVIRAGHGFASPEAIAVSDDYARATHAIHGATDFLAELDGNPSGCASLVRDEGIGWLGGATTIPRYRERGVQGALVRERMATALDSGCDLAVATAAPAGASARNLARLGFTLVYCQAVMTKVAG